jgi:hypothetical protein
MRRYTSTSVSAWNENRSDNLTIRAQNREEQSLAGNNLLSSRCRVVSECDCECEQEPDAGIRIAGRLVHNVPRTLEGRQSLRDIASLFVSKSEVGEFGDNVR